MSLNLFPSIKPPTEYIFGLTPDASLGMTLVRKDDPDGRVLEPVSLELQYKKAENMLRVKFSLSGDNSVYHGVIAINSDSMKALRRDIF